MFNSRQVDLNNIIQYLEGLIPGEIKELPTFTIDLDELIDQISSIKVESNIIEFFASSLNSWPVFKNTKFWVFGEGSSGLESVTSGQDASQSGFLISLAFAVCKWVTKRQLIRTALNKKLVLERFIVSDYPL